MQNTSNDATQTSLTESQIQFRHPVLSDGLALYELVKACPPLDVNSSYLYFLQASHFAESCMVAELEGEIVGFVSGYQRPDAAEDLFVWQVAVSSKARGQGLAKRMIDQLLRAQLKNKRPLSAISCTIGPSNVASQGLFKSLAKQHGLTMKVTPFIAAEQFGDEQHEAEETYTLTAPNNKQLNEFLTFRK